MPGAVHVHIDGALARITLASAGKFNAMSRAMWRELKAVFAAAAQKLLPLVADEKAAPEARASAARTLVAIRRADDRRRPGSGCRWRAGAIHATRNRSTNARSAEVICRCRG